MSAGIACELREVVLRNKPEHMVAISEKATVPVLQLQSGTVIDESIEVMEWALAQSDPRGWLHFADSAETNQLVAKNDGSFKQDLDHYKYFVRFPEHPQEFYRARAETFLGELERRLRASDSKGLMGERTSFADIAIFPFVRQFSKVDLKWFAAAPFPSLRTWLARLEEGELYRSVMQKYPAWVDGDPITVFADAA